GRPATSRQPRQLLVRARTRPVLVAVVAALLAGVGGAVALAAAGGIPPGHAALICWISLSYAVSGLVAWWRRPANRFGLLMILTGFCMLATTLTWSPAPLAHTIGLALDLLPLALITHVFLAFPDGRLL